MRKSFEEALAFRHACKVFDDTKKIPDEDIHFILDAARRSPSSFGMEPWRFLVVTNEELKAKLRPACWNQVQITSCSHLVVVLAAIESVKPEFGVVEKRFARRDLSKEQLDTYLELYSSHLKKTLSSDENIYAWTSKQTYLAVSNMMTAAAVLGVDSCPIEGLEKEKVEEILELDTSKYQLSMLLPLGYRVNPQSSQLRLSFEEVVKFIN